MASIERTAYPRFRRLVTAREVASLSQTGDEVAWARARTGWDEHQLALVLSLRGFRGWGISRRRGMFRWRSSSTFGAVLICRRGTAPSRASDTAKRVSPAFVLGLLPINAGRARLGTSAPWPMVAFSRHVDHCSGGRPRVTAGCGKAHRCLIEKDQGFVQPFANDPPLTSRRLKSRCSGCRRLSTRACFRPGLS